MTIKFKLVNGNNISVDVSISRSVRIRKSIGRKVSDAKKWNHETGRAKNDSTLNRHLRSVEDLCERIYDKLLLEKRISRDAFLAEFKQNYGHDDSMLLIKWIEKLRDDEPLETAYRTSFSSILNNHMSSLRFVTLKSINRTSILNFQSELVKKGLSPSTVNDYVNLVLIAINKYYKKYEIPNKTSYLKIDRLTESSKKKIVLRQEDIDKLKDANLSGKLDYTRCTFLMGVVSAARFSDLWKMDDSYINGNVLTYNNQKTIDDIDIPNLTIQDVKLFKEINGKRQKFQSTYYNTAYQNYLDWLPLMGKAAGLDRSITIRNKHKQNETFLLYEKITAHTSRRTFCHLNFRETKKYDILQLKDFLGHKSVVTTQNYLNNLL